MSVEGVIQYRLFGDHPAASGRYLTIGFPGETTTKDKIVEQVIQEHRINTSRYKLEVCKLVSARDVAGGSNGASPSPPPATDGSSSNNNNINNANGSSNNNTASSNTHGSNSGNNNATSNGILGSSSSGDASGVNSSAGAGLDGSAGRDAVVSVVLHGNEELRTYDRLTITVSQRQLADDDATRREQEESERQQRVREMEAELLQASNSNNTTWANTHNNNNSIGQTSEGYRPGSATPPPSTSSGSPSAAPQQQQQQQQHQGDTLRGSGRAGGAASPGPAGSTVAVDTLRLQRATALANQRFPVLKDQHSGLSGIDDPANTHQCVLCRLPAFEETLTSCCRFSVCASCYASAADMDMEEGRCPVCGSKSVLLRRDGSKGLAEDEDDLSVSGPNRQRGGNKYNGSSTGLKRAREGVHDAQSSSGGWKREGATTDSKDALQRTLGLTERRSESHRRDAASGRGGASGGGTASGKKDVSGGAAGATVPREVLQIEERLRHDLEKALAALDGPDALSAAAKAKRVISAELAALCEE